MLANYLISSAVAWLMFTVMYFAGCRAPRASIVVAFMAVCLPYTLLFCFPLSKLVPLFREWAANVRECFTA